MGLAAVFRAPFCRICGTEDDQLPTCVPEDNPALVVRDRSNRRTPRRVAPRETPVDVSSIAAHPVAPVAEEAAEVTDSINRMYQQVDQTGRRRLIDFTNHADQLIAELRVHDASCEQDLRAFHAWSRGIDTSLSDLAQLVTAWQRQHQRRVEQAMSVHEAFSNHLQSSLECLHDRKGMAKSLLLLPGEEVARRQEEITEVCNIRGINEALNTISRCRMKPPLSQHPAVALVKQSQKASLLPSLSADLLASLKRFLGANKQLVRTKTESNEVWASMRAGDSPALCVSSFRVSSQANAQLLYKASRDGWLPKDFYGCCSEKGPTLTIIKAAGSEYLFGAYTAVSWPKPIDRDITVPDPSGASFLFSLTNAYDHPFRLSLVDRSRCISISSLLSPIFGAQVKSDNDLLVKSCNFVLMSRRHAADEVNGNFSNNHSEVAGSAYQFDASSDQLQPPNEFRLDNTTLAGQRLFAAAEIEVYTL